jgi:hypothetical protein
LKESEHLVRLALKDGTHIDFHRDADKTVRICYSDHCVILPNATAQLTASLFSLLEPLGETILEEETE